MIGSAKITSRQVDYIPVGQFSGLEVAAPTMTITAIGAASTLLEMGIESDSNGEPLASSSISATRTGITGVQKPPLASAGAGTPAFGELSTIGLMGLLMDSAGDDIRHLMRIPSYWDRTKDLFFRVLWTSLSTETADTITWKLLYRLLTIESTIVAAPATALDTVLVIDNVVNTLRIHRTANGILNGKTIVAEDFLSFIVEMDAFAGGLSENKYLLGLEIEYTPKLSRWSRRVSSGRDLQK